MVAGKSDTATAGSPFSFTMLIILADQLLVPCDVAEQVSLPVDWLLSVDRRAMMLDLLDFTLYLRYAAASPKKC